MTRISLGLSHLIAFYLIQRVGCRLQLPTAPCLRVGGRKAVALPMEVCKIAKGQRRLQLDDKQTAQVPSNKKLALISSVRRFAACDALHGYA